MNQTYLFGELAIFKVELGPAAFAWVEAWLHLRHGARQDYERIDALDGGSKSSSIPYVSYKHVISSSNLLLALLSSHKASAEKLLRSFLELPVNDLT